MLENVPGKVNEVLFQSYIDPNHRLPPALLNQSRSYERPFNTWGHSMGLYKALI